MFYNVICILFFYFIDLEYSLFSYFLLLTSVNQIAVDWMSRSLWMKYFLLDG